MSENKQDFEVIEETEAVIIEEKPGIFKRIGNGFAKGAEFIKTKGKYIAGGAIGAAACTAVGFGISTVVKQKQIRKELDDQGLTIEDVPELQAELESEFGPYAEA